MDETDGIRTYKHGFGHCENLILGEKSILIFVVQVEEPFNVLHEVVEHHPVETRHQVLR